MMSKRVLYITAGAGAMYWWENGELQGPARFNVDQQGLEKLEKYLTGSKEMLTSVIVDMVEEEFRNEHIPHLSGNDRKSFINRRLNQYYRTTPYRSAKIVGREKTGRKDDKVVFTALTNPEVLTPWLEVLERCRVPVDGVFTPSFVAEQLVKRLGLEHDNLLFISHQEKSGVRQGFFTNNYLQLSRLVPVSMMGGEEYAAYILAEVEKTRRYLTRLQLLSFDKPLDVCVVSDEEATAKIKEVNQDTELTRWHVVSMKEVLSILGQDVQGTRYCDAALVLALTKKIPRVDYSIPRNRKYNVLRRTRLSMYAASIMMLTASIVLGAMNYIEGALLVSYSDEALESAIYIRSEYEKVLADTPQTPVSPEGLKEGVDIAKSLQESKALPHELLKTISKGLYGDNSLKVEGVEWIVSTDPFASVADGKATNKKQNNQAQRPARFGKKRNQQNQGRILADNALAGEDGSLYQIALIKGSIRKFKGNYRDAFGRINKFADRLIAQKHVMDVKTVTLPLDVSSRSNLKGKTGEKVGEQKSDFTLRAVIQVRQG